METVSQFDLNKALRLWLQRLGQSPQVKAENLQELESHVRDSVVNLQSKGLSSEESFLVATHRVGHAEKLGEEFAKVNLNLRNIIIHGAILVYFSISCFLLWAILRLPLQMESALQGRLPGFTRLVMDWGSYLAVPPALAAGYCIYVWIRKSGDRSSWIGLFASTMAVLFFMTLPTMFAIVLPVVAFMQTYFLGK